MNIDEINNGIVLDHIKAGLCMDIYKYLKLDKCDCSVAVLKNVRSSRLGRKDIIKIDTVLDIDLDVLGYIDPGITVNIINNGHIQKKHLSLPTELVNVISCSNPRCITMTEQEIDQRFFLADEKECIYRCCYCEAAYKKRS